VLFLIGVYVAGKEYALVFIKWSIIKAFEKLSAEGQHQPADVMKIE
jgi:hypothetical protein